MKPHDNDRNPTPALEMDSSPRGHTGWAIITDNATAIGASPTPTYSVTERRWDPDANGGRGAMKSCTVWPAQVTATAYDATESVALQEGEQVLFWRHRGDDGKLKNIICAPGEAVHWGKAVDNGSGYGAAWYDSPVCAVDVNPCDSLGNNVDTGTTITVNLPQTVLMDPNVREDDVIAYVAPCYTSASVRYANRVCIYGEQMQPKVGSVVVWHDAGTIPAGWALADGGTHDGVTTRNLKGRFIVGYDSGDADYSTIGNTGGSKTHTHNDHANHTHNLVGGTDIASGSNYSCTTGNESSTLTHSTDDGRPPYYTLVWIERVN